MFSYEQFDFGVQDKYISSKSFQIGAPEDFQNPLHECYGEKDFIESRTANALYSGFGFYQEKYCQDEFSQSKNILHQQPEQAFSDYGFFDDDLQFNMVPSPVEVCLEEITKLAHNHIPTELPKVVEVKKEKRSPFCLSSFDLLNNVGSGFKRLSGEKIIEPSFETTCSKVGDRKLSTEEIMRVAGESFVQTYSSTLDSFQMLTHPFGSSFSGLSGEEIKDVQLVISLLSVAEKVSDQQFQRASLLLDQCDHLSSDKGTLVQRVVYYFAEALREKIDRETGRIPTKGLGKKQPHDFEEEMMNLSATTLACYREIPFCQVAQFTGIQAILDNITDAKKVHVIDFGIREGIQWTALMQALADLYKPIEHLKITAVVSTSKSKIEETTGTRLSSFAKTMNLPFSFKVVTVPDMLDLKEAMFDLDSEEAVCIYFPFLLRTMISQPNQLDSLMRVVRNINPCILVVNEVEANLNSPIFVNRFIDALFYFGAYFDCLGACMDQNDPSRMVLESLYFGQGLRNIVACEGDERIIRHVKIGVWRAFFTRFGIVETELSMSAIYQASLVLKQFGCGNSCSLELDGKTLLLGWQGTPLHSLSAWKLF